MTFKHLTLALAISSLTLTGCGGGGSSSDTDTDTGDTVTPVPEVELKDNATAKRIVNATDKLSALNVVVAVADTGLTDSHVEFAEVMLDSRSSAVYRYSDFNLAPGEQIVWDYVAGDDYDVDTHKNGRSWHHGTEVASVIFGAQTGFIEGMDALILDASYSGEDSDGDFETAFVTTNPLAAYMATIELATVAGIDFLNISAEDAALVAKTDSNGDSGEEFAAMSDLATTDTGVIVAAGNTGRDYTEIFVSATPDCTQDELDTATGSDLDRCLDLNFTRKRSDLITYSVDSLAPSIVMVGAINEDLSVASFSAVPGTDAKIQSRFLVAPGVGLDVATGFAGDEYATINGTSFAAPIVTAAAAAVKSKFGTLSNKAVLEILLDTADRSFDGYDAAKHGMGILDVEAALNVRPSDYAI